MPGTCVSNIPSALCTVSRTLYGFASVFKEKDVTDCCLSFCPAVFTFFLFQLYSLERECLPEREGQAERDGHLRLRGALSRRRAPSHDLKSGPERENQEADA